MSHRRRERSKKREQRDRETTRLQRRETLKRVAAVAVVGLVLLVVFAVATQPPTGGTPGAVAPDFTLQDSEGRTFNLRDFRGKPVVLFFMTTGDWCLPCKLETRDHLVPLRNSFGDRIHIVSLEMLPGDYSDADLNAYKATYGSEWTYARDLDGVAQKYGVTTLSVVVIVDAQGFVRMKQADPTADRMSEVLTSIGA